MRAVFSWLQREIPFVLGWRNTLILGASLGAMLVAITLLLEPFGTDRYDESWRALIVAGYGLCVVIPFLAFQGFDRLAYVWQGRRWRLYNEFLSRLLLLVAVVTCCWGYNVLVVNRTTPTWGRWLDYVIYIALPHAAVLAPLWTLLAVLLIAWFPEPVPGARRPLVVRGRNRGEALRLMPEDFVFAEAQQNYVSICRRQDGRLLSDLIRAPLSDVERQLPGALRIHRSYLVNPKHVLRVEGNARKRELVLDGLDRRLPMSSDIDPGIFQ